VSNRVSAVSTVASDASAIATLAAVGLASANAVISNLTSAHNALSNVVSNMISAGGGGVSVTSTELSAVSAQAHSALSNAMSIGTVTANDLSNDISAINAFLDGLSVKSAATSVKGLQSVLNQLSNRISAGGAASVTSTELSAVSATADAARSVLSLAITSVDTRVNTVSDQVSVMSVGLGGVQRHTVTGAQVISATSFTNISGLSVSVAANAMYEVNGRVLFTLSILTGTAFGFTYPGNNQVSVGTMTMECITSIITANINATSANFARGKIGQAQMSTAATTNISLLGGASATTYALEIYGMINVTSAGTLQLQAKQSATGGGVNILAGSFLRAYKLT
jgi:hypothetical protein